MHLQTRQHPGSDDPTVDIDEIDPSAGVAASSPEVVVETSGTKTQADTTVADINPQSGAGADVAALVFAAPAEVGDLRAAAVVGYQSGTRVFAPSAEVGDLLTAEVVGCPVPRPA